MPADNLVHDLCTALSAVPLIDPHSHIEPLSPVSTSLDDILGYHYYTELAHSAGMSQAPLAKDVSPRERVRAIVQQLMSQRMFPLTLAGLEGAMRLLTK